MDNSKIVDMYNNKKIKLDDIAKEIGVSKRTIQRNLSKDGWVYDRNTRKYIHATNAENIKKEVKIENVNRTYSIPKDIDKALKIKSAIEGKTVSEIIRDVLKNNIESKYFKF